MTAFRVVLPWPDRKLSPNSPGSWQSKLAAKNDARDIGWALAISAKTRAQEQQCFGSDELEAVITFLPSNNRRFDLDNIFASEKNYIDGICAALNIDDNQIKRVTLEWGVPIMGGAVEFLLGKIGSITITRNTAEVACAPELSNAL